MDQLEKETEKNILQSKNSDRITIGRKMNELKGNANYDNIDVKEEQEEVLKTERVYSLYKGGITNGQKMNELKGNVNYDNIDVKEEQEEVLKIERVYSLYKE